MKIDALKLNFDLKQLTILICLTELIFLVLLFKSIAFSFVLFIIICTSFVLYLFPESGFALAFSGNILLYVFFDNFKIGITAPVVIVHALLIVTATFIYLFKKHGSINILQGKTFWIALLIGLIMIIGLFFSSNKSYGATKILFYFLFNIPLITIPFLFINDFKKLENLFMMVYTLGIVLSLLSISAAADSIYFKFLRFSVSDSVNPIFLSRSLGISSLCGIYLIAKSRHLLFRVSVTASLFLLMLPMVWSGSRAPLIGLLLSILLYYLLQPSQSFFRKAFLSLAGVLSGIYFLVFYASQITTRMTTPIAEEASTAFRFIAWFEALKNFIASPIIGIGTGSFLLETPWLPFIYPHNLILELASENGISGLILLLTFIYFSIKLGMENIKFYAINESKIKLQLSIAALCIFLYMLWNAMFSGDISNNGIVWFSSGLIGVLNISHKVLTHSEKALRDE